MALDELMYCPISVNECPIFISLRILTITAAPSKSKTIETVVEVGMPNVLNTSSKSISASITATKITITSEKVNICGLKIPFLATSIIPDENIAPARTPSAATSKIIFREPALEPTAEFKKFTASLLTPTTKSVTASVNSSTIKIRYTYYSNFVLKVNGSPIDCVKITLTKY